MERVSEGVFVEAGGLVVTIAESNEVRAAVRGREARAPVATDLRAALIAADFDIVAELDLTADGRPLRGSARPELAVAIGANEGAVLLIETAGGVLHWALPEVRDEGTAQRRGGRGGLARFDLTQVVGDTLEPPARRGPVLDWIADKLIDPVRTIVLRFVVSKAIDVAVQRIEGDNPTGPVLIRDIDPSQWVTAPIGDTLPQGRPLRILLMIHGTFSSTVGSFGHLAGLAEGRSFLDAALSRYDLILGHDHKTLAEEPRANAEAILATLTSLKLPSGSTIDAVAYSRGGLVYRVLAEELLPLSGLEATLGSAVFVGCTNGGTNLAEPQNWAAMVDTYTNILVTGARALSAAVSGGALSPVVTVSIRTLGRFVQMFSQVAISERRVPGLAAMEPDGELVRRLNRAGAQPAPARYLAVTANFEPRMQAGKALSTELAGFLADRITDRLFAEDNDLVVHTRAMTEFGDRKLEPAAVHPLDDGEIYHTVYFGEAAVAQVLASWLTPADGLTRTLDANAGPRRRVSLPGSARDLSRLRRGPGAALLESPATLPAPSAPAPVDRFIAAEMESYPVIERAANVYVTVSPESVIALASATASQARITLDSALPLDVALIPHCNCAVRGDAVRSIDVAEPGEQVLRFTIDGISPGSAELLIEARQGNATVASFLLAPIFVAQVQAPLSVSQPLASPELAGGDFPVLRIYEFYGANGALTLRFDLICDKPAYAESGESTLPPSFDLRSYVLDTLDEIEAAWTASGSAVPGSLAAQEAQAAYATFIAAFRARAIVRTNEIVPKALRETLWAHRDEIKSIQVISQEPLLPWELMYITDPSGKSNEKRGFLTEWGLVRWLHGVRPAGRDLVRDRMRTHYVIPKYLDPANTLSGALEERAVLKGHFPDIEKVTPTSLAVQDFLAEPHGCELLHFACHGIAEQRAVISADLLMEGLPRNGNVLDDRLSADQVKTTLSLAPDACTLVFLNSCQTGRAGEGIVGVGGFADAFLRPYSRNGAMAFVGALWSISDSLSLTFVDAFYEALLAGATLVEAAALARKACADGSDFTWLAYTVYGNPMARIVGAIGEQAQPERLRK
ncbi:DUF7379 domain-containing protein [Sphingomonas psychrotolerans]|uniref:Uncharacterized protein n=1 Tax=Sphingomonas psychrotolerans TaxID=1327635 RepID=A0A2K8MF71_9SPHN|nr:CHAT domain-containing protein [Sphingomonas psychrotolerans]ATY32527.1 hypothetical protein CVN68_11535 [Sphingomonas psychrotolerans]